MESRIRGWGSRSWNSTAAATGGTVLAPWASRPSPGCDVDTNVPTSRPPRRVESTSPEGGSVLGV